MSGSFDNLPRLQSLDEGEYGKISAGLRPPHSIFTLAEVDSRQRLSPLCDRKQTSRSANGSSAKGQMRALRQSLPAFRDLEGRLPLLPPVERRPSPHVLAETPPKRGSLQMEANMGEVIRFVSKAERERLRLIQEA